MDRVTTQHRGYTIEVLANQSKDLWAADVLMWPTIIGSPGMRVDKGVVQACDSQREAQEAGRRWGEVRIDNWVETRDSPQIVTNAEKAI